MSGLLTKMKNKKYRDSYVASHLGTGIPHQIRALRVQRRWNQQKLGAKANKPQNVISRVEDPNYGKASLSTLLDIASAFDVALLVKFVPFSRFIQEHQDVHPESLHAASFDEEFTQTHAPRKLHKVAAEIGEQTTDTTGSNMAIRTGATAGPTDYNTDIVVGA